MKWTLVTGSAKRLGAEIARELHSKGYKILIHYNKSKKQALALAKELEGSEIVQGDFSSEKEVKAFIQKLKGKDIEQVIHNVGNYAIEGPIGASLKDWNDLFQTNLFAPIQINEALFKNLKKNKGRIVFIGVSGMNYEKADTYATAYLQSKTALLGYSRALAKELAPSQVTVNMVSPGLLDIAVDYEKVKKDLPMKRAGTPREVARVVAFLLDKESSYITGQNIEVAGALKL